MHRFTILTRPRVYVRVRMCVRALHFTGFVQTHTRMRAPVCMRARIMWARVYGCTL